MTKLKHSEFRDVQVFINTMPFSSATRFYLTYDYHSAAGGAHWVVWGLRSLGPRPLEGDYD